MSRFRPCAFLSGVRSRAPTCPRPSTVMTEYDYFPDHFHDTDKRRCPDSATATSPTRLLPLRTEDVGFEPYLSRSNVRTQTYFIKCHLSCAYRIILACVASLGFTGVANHLNNKYGMCGANQYMYCPIPFKLTRSSMPCLAMLTNI